MATLPKNPKGRELEEYVAAWLQLSGFYIDRNIHEEHEGTEVLELDVVATRYKQQPERIVVEVKSGDWDFANLFKLGGFKQYLDIDHALFFAQRCNESRMSAYRRVVDGLRMRLTFACLRAWSLAVFCLQITSPVIKPADVKIEA